MDKQKDARRRTVLERLLHQLQQDKKLPVDQQMSAKDATRINKEIENIRKNLS